MAHRDHFVRRLSVCVCMYVSVCVCLSNSHTFLIVTHSYVSQATHAFLRMLPVCFMLHVKCSRRGKKIHIEINKCNICLVGLHFCTLNGNNFHTVCHTWMKLIVTRCWDWWRSRWHALTSHLDLCVSHGMWYNLSLNTSVCRSSSCVVVKLLACGARGPEIYSQSHRYNFRDWLSPASKSRYGWKIAKVT